MARHPTFFLLGALGGLGLWLVEAPTPFPLLGMIALVCGVLGFGLSIAYVASFEPWRIRNAFARLAGGRRRVTRTFGEFAGELERPPVSAARARS